MKRDSKRKGFTLIELLIVIVVIGILSAMMMISSTEAVASAKAASIVGNMRTIKTAALAFYIDQVDKASGGASLSIAMTDVTPYLNATSNANLKNSGCTYTISGNYIECTIGGNASEIARVQAKLKERASSANLLKSAADSASEYDASASKVYMAIFDKGATTQSD